MRISERGTPPQLSSAKGSERMTRRRTRRSETPLHQTRSMGGRSGLGPVASFGRNCDGTVNGGAKRIGAGVDRRGRGRLIAHPQGEKITDLRHHTPFAAQHKLADRDAAPPAAPTFARASTRGSSLEELDNIAPLRRPADPVRLEELQLRLVEGARAHAFHPECDSLRSAGSLKLEFQLTVAREKN